MSAPPQSTALDSESRVSNVIAMVAATLAIGTITTVARFYTRFVIVKSAGIDDWFALLSLVSGDLKPQLHAVPFSNSVRSFVQ